MNATTTIVPEKLKIIAADASTWERYCNWLEEAQGENAATIARTEGPPEFAIDMMAKVRSSVGQSMMRVSLVGKAKLVLRATEDSAPLQLLAGDRVSCKGVSWKVDSNRRGKLVLKLIPPAMPKLHTLIVADSRGEPMVQVYGASMDQCRARAELLDALLDDAGRFPAEYLRQKGCTTSMMIVAALVSDELTDELRTRAAELTGLLKEFYKDDLPPPTTAAQEVTPP